MGCCNFTSSAEAKDKLIGKQLAMDAIHSRKNLKIALLGCSKSGKTTLLKQLNELYGASTSNKKRVAYKSTIYQTIYDDTRKMVDFIQSRDASFRSRTAMNVEKRHTENIRILYRYLADEQKEDIVHDNDEKNSLLLEQSLFTTQEHEFVEAAEAVYHELTEYLKEHSMSLFDIGISESYSYFMANGLKRLLSDTNTNYSYTPSANDIIHTYTPSNSCKTRLFAYHQHTFEVVDIGSNYDNVDCNGKSCQLTTALPYLDSFSAVVCCVALDSFFVQSSSSFNIHFSSHECDSSFGLLVSIFGEDITNVIFLMIGYFNADMKKQLQYFHDVVNHPLLTEVAKFVFFTKKDLVFDKYTFSTEDVRTAISGSNLILPTHNYDLASPQDINEAAEHVRDLFSYQNKDENTYIYSHIVPLSNRDFIDKVWNDLTQCITMSMYPGTGPLM